MVPTAHYKHATQIHTLQLLPLMADILWSRWPARRKRGQKEIRERRPRHNMIPRTCVLSPQRLKASY